MGETLTKTAGLEKVAQRLTFRVGRCEQDWRLPIEAHDLAEQREVRRRDQIPPLGEEPVGAAAAVLEPGPSARHGERHVRVAGGHAELGEQPHEIRIRAVVVHEEPRVERHGARRALNQHGVRVAAQPALLFEEVHAMLAAQEVRGGQSGNARADHRNCLHRCSGIPVTAALCQAFVHDKSLTTEPRRDTLGGH